MPAAPPELSDAAALGAAPARRPEAPSPKVVPWLFGPGAPWLLAVAVLVLRGTSFAVDLLNLDECDFWLFGRMMKAGATPYLGVADIKPPLTYLAFYAADALGFGRRALDVPLLGVTVVLGTAFVLHRTAALVTADRRVGWAAAWLSLVAGLSEVPSVNAEVLMNLPAALALASLAAAELAERPRARADLLAGFWAGVATAVKLQAGILVVAFSAATAWSALRGPRPGAVRRGGARLLALGVGYAVPWALMALVFAGLGALPELYDWVVRRNVFQIHSANTFSLANVLPSIAVGLGGPAFAWWMALRGARRPATSFERALVVLLVLTVLPVSIGRRFYEHYFLQFVPPLALLGAGPLADLVAAWGTRRGERRVALASLLVPLGYVGFVVVKGVVGGYAGQEPRAQAIAAWLRANSRPEERVFMWGDYSVVYCLADRLPATRYMRTAPHVGDFDPMHLPRDFDFTPYVSERDVALALADLEARPPALVLDTSPADLHGWARFPLAKVPALHRWISERYAPVGAPEGAVVYRRRERGEPAPAGAAAEAP